MRIGILGIGTVAQVLGQGLIHNSHEIFIGCRDSKSIKVIEWLEKVNHEAQVGSMVEAVEFGEIAILAINPWTEIEKVIRSMPPDALAGKTIIDLSNNIIFENPPRLAFTNISLGELIQSWLPQSKVVKTLNITPAHMMVNPSESGLIPSVMWISGNNSHAKNKVRSLLIDLGWDEVVDLGDLKNAKLQESIGLLTSIVVSGILSNQKQE